MSEAATSAIPSAPAEKVTKPAVSILLPVRNEGGNLRIMLKFLQSMIELPYEVVVIYDTADDNCIPVIEEIRAKGYSLLRGVHNTIGRGVGNAIRAGVANASADVVTIMCADDIGPVYAVKDMLALIDDVCDFVSCTRYARGGRRYGGSLIGSILSRTANWLFHRMVRSPFSDATTGAKMFRRSLFDSFALESRVGWAVVFEMTIKAQNSGLRLGEVPIVAVDRPYGGTSSFRLGPWVLEYSRWFFWGMRQAFTNRSMTRDITVRIPSVNH